MTCKELLSGEHAAVDLLGESSRPIYQRIRDCICSSPSDSDVCSSCRHSICSDLPFADDNCVSRIQAECPAEYDACGDDG